MLPALFVVLGAALWATDTLFRFPTVQQVTPITIVFFEHVFAVITCIVSFAILRARGPRTLILNGTEMLGAAFVGIFGSGLATVLFTASFQHVNPSVAILLQKVQPIIVITLSSIFLEERLTRRFWIWCVLALTAAYFVSFPHGVALSELKDVTVGVGPISGVFFALIAAALWAVSTVAGKVVLKSAHSEALTFWRFVFGLAALSVLVAFNTQAKIELPFVLQDHSVLRSLFLMAFISGYVGITIYYRGLSKVPASVATILELSFPLTAMWINSRFLDVHLDDVQVVAAFALLIAMVGVSRSQMRSPSR